MYISYIFIFKLIFMRNSIMIITRYCGSIYICTIWCRKRRTLIIYIKIESNYFIKNNFICSNCRINFWIIISTYEDIICFINFIFAWIKNYSIIFPMFVSWLMLVSHRITKIWNMSCLPLLLFHIYIRICFRNIWRMYNNKIFHKIHNLFCDE